MLSIHWCILKPYLLVYHRINFNFTKKDETTCNDCKLNFTWIKYLAILLKTREFVSERQICVKAVLLKPYYLLFYHQD